MLDKLRLSLRISHRKLDSDLQANVEACKLDLQRVGVVKIDDTNPLIFKVIELYCKWQYDFNDKGDKYERAYNNLINALSLCGDYNV